MHELAFRNLDRRDFPFLRSWLREPHVERWWNHEVSDAALERDFGAVVDGRDPADVFIVSAGARPIGLLQRYRFADNPEYLDELAPVLAVPPEALGIDYFVGDPAALRQGLGTDMIRIAVARIWIDHPTAPAVVVPVNEANVASWRVLERAGFERVARGPLRPDNPIDRNAHFIYRIEPPRPCADRSGG
ncbi:MAG TPA: GNAT family N-acetyltransferase [Caldimonas sp.]|jgi:aminoglycoside 6'-N-acetyltransferase|nr:GNAT family N-acetyltransferase [Caldimonas sp.]HEX2540120.1 GNAT family N-acetyltransferase [Caldimonas sp.]